MKRTLGWIHLMAAVGLVVFAPLAEGCGGSPKKGSSATSASAAKTSNQKANSAITQNTDKAQSSGDTLDGVTCDASLEGLGYCASDSSIVFCASGAWWALECSAIDPDAFCGEDDDGLIDCYLP